MKENFELNATGRQDNGKGASRRLRHDNRLPGVIYGAGKGAQSLSFDHNEVQRHLEHEAFYSHVLSIIIDGKPEKAVLRDVQRHPSKPRIMHLDFQRVSATEKMRMRVPLHFLGEDVAPGIKREGGVISHLLTDVEVNCLASDLPEYLEVDLTDMNLGDTFHLTDLKLPDGVELTALAQGDDHDQPIANLHLPRVIVEEEPGATDEDAAGESAADKDEE